MSGLTGSPLLRPAELLASLTETFTSGLSTVRSPSPLPDITTVATGRFHRRVFHPLDLQLASLHRFLILTQSFDRPARYGRSACFDTMPSSPMSHAALNRSGPISTFSNGATKTPS